MKTRPERTRGQKIGLILGVIFFLMILTTLELDPSNRIPDWATFE